MLAQSKEASPQKPLSPPKSSVADSRLEMLHLSNETKAVNDILLNEQHAPVVKEIAPQEHCGIDDPTFDSNMAAMIAQSQIKPIEPSKPKSPLEAALDDLMSREQSQFLPPPQAFNPANDESMEETLDETCNDVSINWCKDI